METPSPPSSTPLFALEGLLLAETGVEAAGHGVEECNGVQECMHHGKWSVVVC